VEADQDAIEALALDDDVADERLELGLVAPGVEAFPADRVIVEALLAAVPPAVRAC
jgi:hypothetical protein